MERCNAPMRWDERCARGVGHADSHRTAWALETDRIRQAKKRRAQIQLRYCPTCGRGEVA